MMRGQFAVPNVGPRDKPTVRNPHLGAVSNRAFRRRGTTSPRGSYAGPSARRVGEGGNRAGFQERREMPACELRCWLSARRLHGRVAACGVGLVGGALFATGWVGGQIASALRGRRGGDVGGWACRPGRGRMRQGLHFPFSPPADGSCRTEGACLSLYASGL